MARHSWVSRHCALKTAPKAPLPNFCRLLYDFLGAPIKVWGTARMNLTHFFDAMTCSFWMLTWWRIDNSESIFGLVFDIGWYLMIFGCLRQCWPRAAKIHHTPLVLQRFNGCWLITQCQEAVGICHKEKVLDVHIAATQSIVQCVRRLMRKEKKMANTLLTPSVNQVC